MEWTTGTVGEYVLLAVSGRMDAVTAGDFEKACTEIMDQGKTHVVADLSGVEYISSAGLRSILSSAKKLRGVNGEIRFCGLNGMVRDVFTVSGFAAMFKLFDSAQEAAQD
ncbi:anti-sigma B factor antagonist [Paucidesulfovibrio gracilis DSM 16080]|uniref:Anti-sigma factor antagonist n=1 Tax=Paucidesulfovibrio gracilis DSM 16080 TaxID=1121449 RepID=A0A1T4WYN5_9BACT|nr:STAS domain-containing protein [Paucidesulfovibrio gracilis]SKA81955.1 anti-sigma B factor antagonist [Paucidesulfovibrio gracilis DSM 16080]